MIFQLIILTITLGIYFIILKSVFKLFTNDTILPLQFNWLVISISIRVVLELLQISTLLNILKNSEYVINLEISLILLAFVYLVMFFSRHNKIFLNKSSEKFLLFVCFFCIIAVLTFTIHFLLHSSTESFLIKAFEFIQPGFVVLIPTVISFYLFFIYLFQFEKLSFHFRILLILLNVKAIFIPFQLDYLFLQNYLSLWFVYYTINLLFYILLYKHISAKKGRYLND
jgi:hypothetical protein